MLSGSAPPPPAHEPMHTISTDHASDFPEAVIRRKRSARPVPSMTAHGQRQHLSVRNFFAVPDPADDDDDEEYVARSYRRRSSSGRAAPLPKQHSMPVRDEAGRFTGVRLKTAEERARREGGGVFKTAAIEVLRQEMRLMSTGDITRIALNRGLLGQTGKTPEATMASALYTDVKRKEANSAFIRPVEGMFGLREWADMSFDKQFRVIEGSARPPAKAYHNGDEEFVLPPPRRTASQPLPLPARRVRVHKAAGPAHPYLSSALPRASSDPYVDARRPRRVPRAYDEASDEEEEYYAGGYKRSYATMRDEWDGKQVPAESSASQASRDGASFMLLLSAIDELQRSGDDSATVMQGATARPRGGCDEVSSPAPKKQSVVQHVEEPVPTSNESSASQVGLFAALQGGALSDISQRFLLRAQQAAQLSHAEVPMLPSTRPSTMPPTLQPANFC